MSTAKAAATATGPLRGVRVLEVCNVVAGPVCCQILGDFGADIVKIEHPESGDSMRMHGPAKDGIPLWWKIVGRNKRSIGLYLGDPQAAEVLLDLVETADVMVENFRPGTLERYGLGYDILSKRNPSLILVRLSGFGQGGPYMNRPAFGTVAEVMSTFAHITGPEDAPPTLPPYALADSIAGIAAAAATTMALFERARSGMGQVIDMSIIEPMFLTVGFQAIWYDQLGIIETRRGNRSMNSAPRNTYKTKDGRWIGVAASTQSTADRIVRLIGSEDLMKEDWFHSNSGRAQHASLIDERISAWMQVRSLDEAMASCISAQVPCAPVYDIADFVNDPHVKAMEMVTRVPDDDLGPILMPNVLCRMSRTPGNIRFTGRALGENTDEILIDEFGMDKERIASLRERGVLR